MLCPKCGFNSFEYNTACPKCKKDLTPVKRQLFLTEPAPGDVNFFAILATGDLSTLHREREGAAADEESPLDGDAFAAPGGPAFAPTAGPGSLDFDADLPQPAAPPPPLAPPPPPMAPAPPPQDLGPPPPPAPPLAPPPPPAPPLAPPPPPPPLAPPPPPVAPPPPRDLAPPPAPAPPPLAPPPPAPAATDTGQLDVSQLLEDPEIHVAPGATQLPRRAQPPTEEAQPETILDVEVVDDDAPPEVPVTESLDFDEEGGETPATPLQEGGGAPYSLSRPQDASETFMVPQANLQESAAAPDEFGDLMDVGALEEEDEDSLAVDSTDMADVGDMLDDLDDE